MKKLSLSKLFVSCTQEEYNSIPHPDNEETLYFVSNEKRHDDIVDALSYSIPLSKENPEES